VKDLLKASRVRAEERVRQLSAKRAADEARKKAKDEADRAVYLEGLAKREKAVWKQVEEYIEQRQPKAYERAVILLVDLHDLAIRQEDETGFQWTMEELRKTHSAKGAFLRRLAKVNL
jgi:DNA transposition AAA+ family ATPase